MSRKSSNPSMPALVTMIPIGPKRLRTSSERGVDGGPVADVDAGAERGAALGLHLLRHLVGGLAVDVEHGDLAALPGQVLADGPAHARAAPGDHRDPAHLRPQLSLPAHLTGQPSDQATTSRAVFAVPRPSWAGAAALVSPCRREPVPVEWSDVIDSAKSCQASLAAGDSNMYC